ncbi:MAG: hypothetical protein Q9188_004939 [Gyalolechia gomerana]
MDSSEPTTLTSPLTSVSQNTFLGVVWASVAVAIIFVAFRFIARIRIFGRLQLDDGLVLFAWLALLINVVLWQTGADSLYEYIAVTSRQLWPPPLGFEHRFEVFLRKDAATLILFYTGLWSIKLSFLLFFKRLGQNVRHQGKIWWVVLGITVAAYIVGVSTIPYRCMVSSFSYMWFILVPVNLLRTVRLSVRKKIALSSIFTITVFTMVFAIIRVVVVSSYSKQPNQTWLYLWSGIEQAVSIIVACIASFPALFRSSEREKHHNIGPSRTHALWKMSTFTRLISIISDRMPRMKRSKEKVQVPTKDSTDLVSPSHSQRPYLETNMLRSVDGNGKFLHSGTFPQNAWLHRVPSDSYVAGDTEASCYSAV